uniref:Serine protease family S09X putative n=1 Tax=Albugo laibachii Nc14 TaxID=890382 RepID=F0WP26_9STRA|nr:serine protease family S09X putative [Albugo laibachii Nc14]|eukprot:CCA23070.1 serine protease family S09X putative [Albugo laibachii Nc14]
MDIHVFIASHGKRIAVIENEFGEEIGIESLVAKDGLDGNYLPEFFELGNGCICCSVRDDLVNTLERLLETKSGKFDYIIVETTGMANPGKVASVFWVDDELEGRMYLDGIITVVDAHNIEMHLERDATRNEAASQLAYADRILLNKEDLLEADSASKDKIETIIGSINGLAPFTWTRKGHVDLSYILEIQAFSTDRAHQVELALERDVDRENEGFKDETESTIDSDICPDSEQVTIPKKKQVAGRIHSGKVCTICVTIPEKDFSLEKLEHWLGEMLWNDQKGAADDANFQIFRIKGVVVVEESPYKHILQGVHDLFEITSSKEEWSDRISRIVFIGTESVSIRLFLIKLQTDNNEVVFKQGSHKMVDGLTANWTIWLTNAFYTGAALITGALSLLFVYQDKLLYFPSIPGAPKLTKDNPSGYRHPGEYDIDYEDVMIPTEDGIRIHAWLLKQFKSLAYPTIIFFHGNSGNIGFRLPNAVQLFRNVKCNILLVDYRGYGHSEGVPSEIGLQLDAKASLSFLRQHKEIDQSKIVVFGRSLGGAVAVYLATTAPKDEVAGVILENTFLSISSMIDAVMPALRYFKSIVLRIEWNNEERVTKLSQPILLIAGTADEVVPHFHMQKLHSILQPINTNVIWYAIENGTHNDTWLRGGHRYFDKFDAFFQQLFGSKSYRNEPKNSRSIEHQEAVLGVRHMLAAI